MKKVRLPPIDIEVDVIKHYIINVPLLKLPNFTDQQQINQSLKTPGSRIVKASCENPRLFLYGLMFVEQLMFSGVDSTVLEEFARLDMMPQSQLFRLLRQQLAGSAARDLFMELFGKILAVKQSGNADELDNILEMLTDERWIPVNSSHD